MIELSRYAFESLRTDEEFDLYRGRGAGEPSSILVLAPVLRQPQLETIKRLEHEYCFRDELDSEWAVRPIGLTYHRDRLVLILEDPGGVPLNDLLGDYSAAPTSQHESAPLQPGSELRRTGRRERLDRARRGPRPTDPGGQPMELGRFLRIAVNLAAGLRKLHRSGLIHKDIKPANILVDPVTGQVRFTGFGISSRLERERQAAEPPEVIAGTLAYMAPEQTGRMNRSIDSRSDLYSLGMTFYQMLTGCLPFTASNPLEWVHCHIARKPAPPGERVADVPHPISAIITKLLAKTAEERYQTAAGVERDLRRCVTDWAARGRVDEFLLGAQDVPDRLLIPEKLYGREREIDALLAAFDRVIKSGTPELVLVSGYSGIGKSSVVNELHKVLMPSRGLFASGKFDQFKRDIPYATLAQAFQGLIRALLGESDAELAPWCDALREALGSNGQLMVNLIPELEALIGPQPPIADLPPQDAQRRFQLVFRRFISVFARAEHPLALFLDDLQWLDAATLELLEHLATQPELRHLLLVGAYRDNEVTPAHPLRRRLEAIRSAGGRVQEIVLAPLGLEDVGGLIADGLQSTLERVRPLAELVHAKTAGNPFFTIQFLTTLAEEGLLAFDHGAARWSWDLERIHAKGYIENVLELMVGKLRRLPAATQNVLQQLACLGNSAAVSTLAMVRGGNQEALHAAFWEAVRAGLVLRMEGTYRFLHDRVQEAAYALIPAERRTTIHLQIGRLLIAKMAVEETEEKIFEIVSQFNSGMALISAKEEKDCVAELNLKAGRRAKGSMAHSSARTYFFTGMELLGEDAWERRHDLAFSLWLEGAECEFLNGNFEEAEALIAVLLSRSTSKIEKAAAYRLKILLQLMRAQGWEAVESGLECLRLLGVEMPAHPTREQCQAEYEEIWQILGERTIESVVDLPLMTDPEKQAAMQLLAEIGAPAQNTDINLHYLIIFRLVNLSLTHGTTDASTHGYASVAIILGPIFHRYIDAYRFARLACSLVEKYGFHAYKARAYLNMHTVSLWTQPITTAIDLARLAFRAGVETGDLTFACYACHHLVADLLFKGCHLDEVWRESENCLEFNLKAKFLDAADIIVSQQRLIQCLRGYTAALSSFSGAEFDEQRFEAQLSEDRMTSMICYYWILKLEACFMSGDYEVASAAARKAETLLWSAADVHLQGVNYYYYQALTIAALHDRVEPGKQTEGLNVLRRSLERFAELAASCPNSFLDKYRLLSAEVARIEGRDLDAMRLYEQAIRAAGENGLVQNEGIADELAAAFYAKRGFETIAHAYLRNAWHCYAFWGANGKVRQLEELYPFLQGDLAQHSTGMIGTPVQQLDLAAVVKAFQAISEEIILEKLIDKLMRTALEQAGAERGFLILARGNEQRIDALFGQGFVVQAISDHGNTTVRFPCPLASAKEDLSVEVQPSRTKEEASPCQLPESLLRYAIRTQESVTLADASIRNLFSEDEYIRRSRPRSVFCLPLIKQGKPIGILYLENNLAPGVFTPNRLATLELIASQAAISLEQAQLYAELTRANEDLQTAIGEHRRTEEALKKSEQQLQDIIDHTPALVTVKDLDFHYLLINREYERRFHVQRDWIRGRTDYDFLPSDLAETVRANDRLVIETGRPIQFELAIPMADGERQYVAVKFLLRDSTGKAYAVCGISTDITERKRAEEAWQKAQADLAHVARLATLGELVTSIAHEINQPLGAIANNAAACVRWLGSQNLEEARRSASMAVAEAHRAGEIIRRVRALANKSPPKKAWIDLNQTIGEAIALAHGELKSNGVLVQTRLAKDLPLLMGDRIQLQQVILNLVVNAVEAMSGVREGSRELSVNSEKANVTLFESEQNKPLPRSFSEEGSLDEGGYEQGGQSLAETEPAHILVSVADSGSGLDAKDLDHLFDAFYTTKPQGLGMGLAISRSIIEAHGGRLWAAANKPKGARFQFTLPIDAGERAT